MVKMPDITKQEFLEAVTEGVRQALWQCITNATGAPCTDFFEAIKQGIEDAMCKVGREIASERQLG